MKKTELISVRISPDSMKKLQEYAEKNDRTISYVANKAIEKFLNQLQEQIISKS